MVTRKRIRPLLTAAAGFVAAAAVLAAFYLLPPGSALGSSLLSLGLDQQRALIASLLASTAIAGAAAALITDSILFSWLTGFVLFAVVFAATPSIDAAPPTLPGERVAASLYVLAIIAVLCCGIAAAGIGAAAGFDARRASVSTWRLVRSGSPSRLAVAASTFLLLGASIFGVLRLPGILMYGPWSGVVEAARPVAQGQQLTFDYWSRALGTTRSAVVVLPPEYASSPDLAFPVLYLLHGSPGSDMDWARVGAATIVGEAHDAGRMPPAVIVYPNGDGPRGGAEDHWADDYVPGDKMESDLINDLIPSIEAHFRVVPDQAHRAIGGLSAGGYGAANLALRHPGEFGVALVFGGDLQPEVNAFGANQTALIANDPLRLALGPKPDHASAFFVGWGASDPLRSENSLFAQRLQARGYDVSLDVVPGAHTWDVWRRLLLAGLDQMGRLLGAPTTS